MAHVYLIDERAESGWKLHSFAAFNTVDGVVASWMVVFERKD